MTTSRSADGHGAPGTARSTSDEASPSPATELPAPPRRSPSVRIVAPIAAGAIGVGIAARTRRRRPSIRGPPTPTGTRSCCSTNARVRSSSPTRSGEEQARFALGSDERRPTRWPSGRRCSSSSADAAADRRPRGRVVAGLRLRRRDDRCGHAGGQRCNDADRRPPPANERCWSTARPARCSTPRHRRRSPARATTSRPRSPSPSGRDVLVTDSGNFQSVLFSFDRDEPSYFPGRALAVDDELVVTTQNVGTEASITVFDHDGEAVTDARTAVGPGRDDRRRPRHPRHRRR